MSVKKTAALTPATSVRDPFAMLRQKMSELDRLFDEATWPVFGSRSWLLPTAAPIGWAPKLDVVEKDKRLVAKMDLPGMKRDDVTVEVTDGCLAISGERRHDAEEKNERGYRYEREYGTFCRVIPLPDDVKAEDIRASFAEGVLEVSIPLPAGPAEKVHKVTIQEPAAATQSAA